MIKDVHINNPKFSALGDRIPCRDDPFVQRYREDQLLEGGCGFRSFGDCDRALLTITSFIIPYPGSLSPASTNGVDYDKSLTGSRNWRPRDPAISNGVDGGNLLRVSPEIGELPSQLHNGLVEGPRCPVVLIPPHLVENSIAGKHFVGVGDEQLKELNLSDGQLR